MSREIKFRAWHEQDKEMVYFKNEKLVKDAHQMQHLANLINGQYGDVLMQFTGLKDKNGVEVYGGDVIKGRVDLGGKLKRFIGAVDINMPYVTVKGVKQYSWKVCQSISDVRLFEVIGNIYENPELINP